MKLIQREETSRENHLREHTSRQPIPVRNTGRALSRDYYGFVICLCICADFFRQQHRQ